MILYTINTYFNINGEIDNYPQEVYTNKTKAFNKLDEIKTRIIENLKETPYKIKTYECNHDCFKSVNICDEFCEMYQYVINLDIIVI